MYKNKQNAIQRARISSGLTQEALAERSGYSADSVRAWESGMRTASLDALGILSEVLGAPWLTGVYLREQTDALNELIPQFDVGKPQIEAVAGYVSCLYELEDAETSRTLIRMIADGRIDTLEQAQYDQIMEIARRTTRAYYEMLFAARKE